MLKVNGEPLKYVKDMTVSDVIKAKKFSFPLLIVKIDGVYIPRESYDATPVSDDATIDIIHLISGG
ncbi:MAG: Sulfur carrier protein ThiS [bacterium ADurb.Bin374]|nr:MAG: Sulfur carrier protein ThiS [bacterium ADurb.Bin374]